MDRFDGKPVLQTTVSAGINKPQELIQKVLDGKAPIYHAEGGAAPVGDDDEKESFGHKVYKHLMKRRIPHAAFRGRRRRADCSGLLD